MMIKIINDSFPWLFHLPLSSFQLLPWEDCTHKLAVFYSPDLKTYQLFCFSIMIFIWWYRAHFLFISTSFISNPLACLSCPLPEMIWATRFSFRSFAWTLGIERQSLRIALFKIHSDPINTDVIVTGKSSHWRFVPLPLSFEMSLFCDHWSLCFLTEPSKNVNTNNIATAVTLFPLM